MESPSNLVTWIPNLACCSKRDFHVTCEGRVAGRSGELKNSGIGDGSAVRSASRVRGGKHKDKKIKAEQKQSVSLRRPDQLQTPQELKDGED